MKTIDEIIAKASHVDTTVWRPEDYKFTCTRKSSVLEECIWWKNNYELRYTADTWLCRRKIVKGNVPSYYVTFYLKIDETDVIFADSLFNRLP